MPIGARDDPPTETRPRGGFLFCPLHSHRLHWDHAGLRNGQYSSVLAVALSRNPQSHLERCNGEYSFIFPPHALGRSWRAVVILGIFGARIAYDYSCYQLENSRSVSCKPRLSRSKFS